MAPLWLCHFVLEEFGTVEEGSHIRSHETQLMKLVAFTHLGKSQWWTCWRQKDGMAAVVGDGVGRIDKGETASRQDPCPNDAVP